MTAPREAIIPRQVVDDLLAAATTELVLVGGQSLKAWMERYDVTMPAEMAYVSRDVDFLASSPQDSDSVRRLARALGGEAQFPRRRAALTAIIGQAAKKVGDDEVYNVDVLHTVFGADREALRARAVEFHERGLTYLVMHPLDVLKSRVDNLYALPEKQNELGRAQLIAGIEVARAFLREADQLENKAGARRPATLKYVAFIEKLATEDSGKKVARRYRIHVADAVEPQAVPSRDFRTKSLPRLLKLMSPRRRRELGLSA
jgi:hypothetical protein